MGDDPQAVEVRNPFPGLRPFRSDEEHVFFGRESQVDRMIDKLAAHRFLAVVGTSGSGKSSLVNCGLRPALHRGNMARAHASWRMAQFRPGSDPIGALARALAVRGVLFDTTAGDGLEPSKLIEATLRLGSLGLVDIVEQARLSSDTQVLVVVDQFEELLRFRALARGTAKDAYGPGKDEVAFVRLLLEARTQTEVPIHVVLTMRSDFLGDCGQFEGLPEAINEGQYLVPRLTREEIRAAITGPVGVAAAEITPVLVTRLLNDVGDNPDQLSILQHALNRTWAYWENESGARGRLDLPHYEAIGGMAHALDRHAEKAYDELGSAERRRLGERVFKALTDKGTDARGIRRPQRLGTLREIVGAPPDELEAVIEVFRKPSRSFLMPPPGEPLTPESDVDISHESLMRVWERLKVWADEEAQSARDYRRLSEAAALYEAEQVGLWLDPQLRLALDWRTKNRPTKPWAVQYQGDFDRAMAFLDRSRDEQNADKIDAEIERRWLAGWSYLPLVLVAVPFVFAQTSIAGWLRTLMEGTRVESWSTPLSHLLAGTPAALGYMLLAPYTKELFRRKALADIRRRDSEASAPDETRETAAAPDVAVIDVQTMVYASFARRTLAQLVDWLVCSALGFVTLVIVMGIILSLTERPRVNAENDTTLVLVVFTLAFWIYHAPFWASKRKATLGMWLAGIVVTDLQGRRLGLLRATARFFARFLSYYTLGGGFLTHLFNKRHQTLHDRLSGTVMLRRPPMAQGADHVAIASVAEGAGDGVDVGVGVVEMKGDAHRAGPDGGFDARGL